MKKILIAGVSILVCAAAAAQEHHHMSDAEFLQLLKAGSSVGTTSIAPTGVTVTVNMTAKSFDFTPSNISCNQGDTLVINLSVPANDPTPSQHGILMEEYLTTGVNVNKGQTKQITIQATKDGTFLFGCNVPDCGAGHSNMFGTLTVKKVSNPAPAVTQLSPSSGPTTGGTVVTITGTNFLGSTVTFGGVAATNVSVTSSTSITATTPARASTGAVPVVVTNSDGQSVSFNSFTYTTPAPSITSVFPATGPNNGGTLITITGTGGFVPGATVTVGGNPAGQVNVVNSTTITAITPLGPSNGETPLHNFDVVVRNPDGTTITKSGAFQYFFAPLSISSLSPSSGLPAGGYDVTITGTGFNSALASTVTFGGVAATNVRVLDAVTMKVTAPAHAAGTVDVVVNFGTSATLANGFTYGTPPPRKRAARH
jgi:hypothetical protein